MTNTNKKSPDWVTDLAIEYAKQIEPVNHPSHYNKGKLEVIAVIDDWALGFCLGNAVKYIARSQHKGQQLTDLRKVIWYVQHEIDRLEKESQFK